VKLQEGPEQKEARQEAYQIDRFLESEFPAIFHDDDHILDYFSCALLSGILLQGFVYISYRTLCFYANIFGVVTTEASLPSPPQHACQ